MAISLFKIAHASLTFQIRTESVEIRAGIMWACYDTLSHAIKKQKPSWH